MKALLQRRNNETISVAFWINVSSEGVLDLFPCIKGGLSSMVLGYLNRQRMSYRVQYFHFNELNPCHNLCVHALSEHHGQIGFQHLDFVFISTVYFLIRNHSLN